MLVERKRGTAPMLVDRTRSLCERGPFERSLAAYTARDDPRGNGKIAC